MPLAIQAEGLSKRYRLGEGVYATLRERLYVRSRGRSAGGDSSREVWALRDVDLEIAEGDLVGIVGRNGAGKTTLLKAVARIVRPTAGVVRVRGRVGALLEVGTGFHPELTGRENVFLNGVILGMTRRDIARRFSDIVEFAGVERFLDTPLKRFSSGMYLRLAFAVAAHIEPDVLIVDEVLAVGDAEFQQRCLGRMSELGQEGRTVLFVSHDTGAVAKLCHRAIWLDEGRVREVGGAHDVIERYLGAVVSRGGRSVVPVSDASHVSALSVVLLDDRGEPTDTVRRSEPLRFAVSFTLTGTVPRLDLALYVLSESRVQVLSEKVSDQQMRIDGPGEFTVRLTVAGVLSPGEYFAGIWLARLAGISLAGDWEPLVSQEVLQFTVSPRPDDPMEAAHRDRLVQPPVTWEIERRPAPSEPGSR